MIIIPIKWLFHWEYTLFSDKPTSKTSPSPRFASLFSTFQSSLIVSGVRQPWEGFHAPGREGSATMSNPLGISCSFEVHFLDGACHGKPWKTLENQGPLGEILRYDHFRAISHQPVTIALWIHRSSLKFSSLGEVAIENLAEEGQLSQL